MLADKFQRPMHRTSVFVHSRPIVALVLRVMLDNFARLRALNLKQLELGPDFTQKQIVAEIDELSIRITELLENIRHLELPKTIVPMEEIIDVTVELVLDRLGWQVQGRGQDRQGRARDGPRLAEDHRGDCQGARDRAARPEHHLAGRDSHKLQPHLEEVTASFADTAGDIVKRVPFLKEAKQPPKPAVGVTIEDGEFPESEGYPAPDAPAVLNRPLRWPQGGGAALGARLGGRMARGFGHDFSHVRLHADTESDALTRQLGSRAITSGSHVYLRNDVTPHDASGGHVLRHELAHVLQQGGPRPLGGAHSNHPIDGRTGGGLRYDAYRARRPPNRRPICPGPPARAARSTPGAARSARSRPSTRSSKR